MKTACTSRIVVVNPRILVGFALYAASLVLTYGPTSSAVAGDNAAAELSPSSQAHLPGGLEVTGDLPGRWIGTGDLTTARYRHTATLLEWDDSIPSFQEVHREALKANRFLAGKSLAVAV